MRIAIGRISSLYSRIKEMVLPLHGNWVERGVGQLGEPESISKLFQDRERTERVPTLDQELAKVLPVAMHNAGKADRIGDQVASLRQGRGHRGSPVRWLPAECADQLFVDLGMRDEVSEIFLDVRFANLHGRGSLRRASRATRLSVIGISDPPIIDRIGPFCSLTESAYRVPTPVVGTASSNAPGAGGLKPFRSDARIKESFLEDR